MKTRFRCIVAITTLVLLGGPLAAGAQEAESGWNGVFYPLYGWAPIYGVDVTLPHIENPCVGCPSSASSGQVSSGINAGAFAASRLEKAWFAFTANVNWAGLSAERASPVARVGVDAFTGGLTGGVRIVKGLYLEAGARRQSLDIGATILDYPRVTWKPGRWEPIIGTTFRPRLGKHWRLDSHLDAGVGGDRLSTVNGSARLEWQPARHFALTMGYGLATLRIEGETDVASIRLEQTLHGPILGVGIPF